MALMLAETYKALLEAGASEAQASKAASELAGYESRLASIDSRLSLVQWMVGFILFFVVGIAIKLFA
jgi:hypothetical protein